MATYCIDISDNKKLGTTSPIAMFVFVGYFIALSALVELGIIYIILLLVGFILTQIFFQYKPRYISLTLKYLFRSAYLTPSFHDEDYYPDETNIPQIMSILNEYDVQKKNEEIGKRRHAKKH